MDIYMPHRPSGAAMLVAAGGGYKRIEVEKEAIPAARWLNEHGIVACVLKYRLPREKWNDGPLAPLQDVHRALRLIRSGHVSRQIDPSRVGVLGFSAGGHLMGLAAARSHFQSYVPLDKTDSFSPRPSVLALAYPVITLKPPYDKTSTRVSLVGRSPTVKDTASWSVETYVRENCPPTFLTQAENDSISNPANTAIMEEACQKAGVKVERHLFSRGGHGFAMGRRNSPTSHWPDKLENWLRRYDMV
ncbi:alpha/beta hydrolase [Phyllobacterium sp. YR531]|uniref:alpha/beta hydrolase n=1 Tax=Phyllobacterium sp. YR531 TaxID=1144343 RepID=UPI001FCCAAE3|nr:alpha/beta hydrolase [Phyllobacterium sp. YR531]